MSTQSDLFARIVEQEAHALDFGFYWENIEQLIEQIHSECQEIKEAYVKEDHRNVEEEVGDLINAAVSLAIFLKCDPRDALKLSVDKFQRRYDCLKKLAKKDGLNSLQGKKMDVLLGYWDKAKTLVG